MKSFVAMVGGFAILIPAMSKAETPAAGCQAQALDLGRGVEVVHAMRAFTGPDGASHVVETELKGATASFMGGSVKLTQFDLGSPTKVALVYGFPGINIPPHPAPYREIFILLSGSSEMRLPSGQTFALKPGTVFIAEDVGSTGRGGRAGPCGYVALDLQFKQPDAALPSTYDKK